MKDSPDARAPIALSKTFGDGRPGGAKFLLAEYMSFLGIGRTDV